MASFTRFGNDLYTGRRSIDFIGKRRLWYVIAALAIVLSIVVPFLRGGFHFGIEFTGGSQYTVSHPATLDQSPAKAAVQSVVPTLAPEIAVVGGNSVRVQTAQLTSSQSEQVRGALAKAYRVSTDDVAFSFIGATWGQDISASAVRGLVIFLVLVALVMALYFRTWKMSVSALIALAHDLILTAGIYGIVGFEVTPAAVIGFLTILGYSLYDTVVVFDKVRENTRRMTADDRRTFAETVNLAVNQTLVRSINTSIVALLPIAGILFIGALVLGAGTLRDISLALFIGIIVGTYSTIFLAAPIYTDLRSTEPAIRMRTQRTLTARARA
ncbi:protein translocase subunit SecF [Amnibacterium sp. CER49]|uniref:protein translocase subunit SecF n=1 Tax=Amnibacterium sp. CER49 TaxID=3039161 RepID=UPI00244C1531|nr:protein translocase subunit SecF [Amnibacterium sp. CER49]MDH2444313.1 protein translocase subunit SecF [Amnibacterium sp. CER49]